MTCGMTLKNLNFRYHIRNYTINLALWMACYSMIWMALAISISSIEKRYSLSSVQSGLIVSVPEIGRISMLFIASHFGNRFSTPRLVAIAGIGVSIGQLMVALPHFLFTPDAHEISSSNEQFCLANSTTTITSNATVNKEAGGNTNAYAMMIAGMVVIGVCVSPISNIALSYIDNNAPEGTATMYFGLIGGGWGLGPVLVSFLAGYIMTIYVDLTPTNLTPDDPGWVGAWWLIILIVSGGIFITSPFIALYPRDMTKKRSHPTLKTNRMESKSVTLLDGVDSGDDAPEKEAEYTIKSLFVTLWRLVRNPVFMTLCLYMVFRDTTTYGYLSFFPKYLELQFRINQQDVGIIAGTTSIVSVLVFVSSGFVIKKLKLSYLGTIKLIFALCLLQIGLHLVMMNIGCDSIQISGQHRNNVETLLTAPCNKQCDCNTAFYTPLCDVEQQLTYFSPCFAGCDSTTNFTHILTQCACTNGADLERGECFHCDRVYKIIFLVATYLEIVPNSCPFPPVTSLLLRAVRKEDKSLALGFSVVIVSLLAWMTCTPLYGKVMDSACSLWQTLGQTRGACWIYDLEKLRFTLFGANIGLYVMSLSCLAFAWWFTHMRNVTWTSENVDKVKRDSTARAQKIADVREKHSAVET